MPKWKSNDENPEMRFILSLFSRKLIPMLTIFFSFFLASVITLSSLFSGHSSLVTIPFVSDLFAGSAPTNLGVNNQQLSACPPSPNCVVSQNGDATHQISPISYNGDRLLAQEILIKVLGVVPRTQIIEQNKNYIRAESTSRLLGFVDDVEFYFPENENLIQVRSSSRLGESDLGVNRRRIEQIRLAFQDLSQP